jgi:SAM-dependent methyltransferase
MRTGSHGLVQAPASALEGERLRSLEAMFDGPTTRRLTELGVAPGWRCLEVGCGAGGVVRWLAARVGGGGRVVATDVDPRFVGDDRPAHLEVRRHDIGRDPLEAGAYDPVHARAVLEHLPARVRALARLVAAAKPGGWVVVEAAHLGDAMRQAALRYVSPPEQAPLVARLGLMAAAGFDGEFGPRLPGALLAAGPVHVGAELHGPLVWGSERSFGHLSARAALADGPVRARVLGAGLVTEEEPERFVALTARPSCGALWLPLVTAWGQRPRA